MNRLTRPVRGLLVAIAALALTGGAVVAARNLPSAAASGTQHAATASGRTIPSTQDAPDSNDHPDADETPEPQETPDAVDGTDTQSSDAASNADRPHNHGWFVSQAANADTPDGFATHGAYVSSIAKGDAGKPGGGTNGVAPSSAGKAKGAAARAAHQH